MIIKIDSKSEIPIYLQLKNEIIRNIAIHELEEGDRLPSVRDFALELDINLHTVNKTYNILKDEGFLMMDRKKGAVLSFRFKETKEKFKNKAKDEITGIVYESVARNIDKKEILKLIEEIYKNIIK